MAWMVCAKGMIVELKTLVMMAAARLVREREVPRGDALPSVPVEQHRTTDERRSWRELKRQVGFRQAKRLRAIERRAGV